MKPGEQSASANRRGPTQKTRAHRALRVVAKATRYRAQSGARFSRNAATPSVVSLRIMFSAITAPAWA